MAFYHPFNERIKDAKVYYEVGF